MTMWQGSQSNCVATVCSSIFCKPPAAPGAQSWYCERHRQASLGHYAWQGLHHLHQPSHECPTLEFPVLKTASIAQVLRLPTLFPHTKMPLDLWLFQDHQGSRHLGTHQNPSSYHPIGSEAPGCCHGSHFISFWTCVMYMSPPGIRFMW